MLGTGSSEVRLKVHIVPLHVPDDALRRPFEPYVKVQKVAPNTRRADLSINTVIYQTGTPRPKTGVTIEKRAKPV